MKRATTGAAIADETNVISIHALVKRATNVINNYIRVAGISIHALVKRATSTLFLRRSPL